MTIPETEEDRTRRQGAPVSGVAVGDGIFGYAGYTGVGASRSIEAASALRIVVTDALNCGVSLEALERAIQTVRAHLEQEAKA